MSRFREDMSVSHARRVLLSNLREEQTCPCCGKRAKIDERPITGGMARSLVAVYYYFKRNADVKWLHAPSFLREQKLNSSNDFGLLRYWNLTVPAVSVSKDGSKFTGIYGITQLGQDFVERKVAIPAKVGLFARRFFWLAGDLITIDQAFRKKFNFNEVVRSAAEGQYPARALPDAPIEELKDDAWAEDSDEPVEEEPEWAR